MLKKIILLFILTTSIFSCNKALKDADVIINKSIEVSGGKFIENSSIEFDFRDKHYKAIRNNGKFQYERIFKDSMGSVNDILSNKGFQRFINELPFEFSDKKETAYSNSVNSVHYFSVLPYGLNAAAVNKTYLGDVEINEKRYYKIKVTFNKDGGGEDFEDVFMYWINAKTFKADYLAYSYNESDGKGFRFREAYNERFVNGIRFVDYKNYKPAINEVYLENLDVLFENDELELLSKIELKNIAVKTGSIQ